AKFLLLVFTHRFLFKLQLYAVTQWLAVIAKILIDYARVGEMMFETWIALGPPQPRSQIHRHITLRPSSCVRPSGVVSGALRNFQLIENTKAPQVGLEPTTL